MNKYFLAPLRKLVWGGFMKKSSEGKKTILLYSPILLGLLIMLPRLLSPNFGFFDDAVTLTRAQEIWAGPWNLVISADGGRFRPLYWLYYAFLYRLFGLHPLGFFIGNLILFLVLIFGVIRLALALGINRKTAWLVGLVFALAGPVTENIYTLSKPELLQAFWILLLLASCGTYLRIKTWHWKIPFILLMAGLAFVACITKETGILLIPASFISLAIYWLWGKLNRQMDRRILNRRIILWWASLIGGIAYFIVSSIFLNSSLMSVRSDNFNFQPAWLYSQFRILLDWMIRDYLYLLPLCLGALVALFKKSNQAVVPLLVECGCWILIWAAVYIPWLYIPEYYLFPVALIAAILCGLLVSLNLTLLQARQVERIIAWASLGVSALLFAITLPNLVTNARLQMTLDRANAEMLKYVVDYAPQGSTVLINIQQSNEYVTEFTLWVNQISNRPDIKVDTFHDQDLATAEAGNQAIWIISPHLENQFYPSVRMGIYQNTSTAWNQDLATHLNGKGEQIEDIRYSFPIFIFDPMRFFCPLTPSLSYCQVPNAPLDHRELSYGWSIERLP